jgi:uncharacterized protein YbaR (Trm112 family)
MAKLSSKNSFQTFWDNVAGIYDSFVLSNVSPSNIKDLELIEDDFFVHVLNEHVSCDKKTVFIEIGSGTGRYLLKSLEKIFVNQQYDQFLSKIVGIDFSLNMIEKSIDKIVNLIPKIAEKLEIDVATVEKWIRAKVMLINADVAWPYLSVEGDALPLVGIMFGTLGNIPQSDHEAVLFHVKNLIDQEGVGIITVFNAEQQQIGKEVYKQLENIVGANLTWNESTKTFSTSDCGFYSHWFEPTQFIELLTKWFNIQEMNKIAKQGIVTKINTPPIKNKTLPVRSGHPVEIFLLCPICSNKLTMLPAKKRLITCQHCSSKFPIKNIQGFKVPILLKETKSSE